MGKAAYNERIKLIAAWDNNLSVGLALAGFFVPFFSAYKAENYQLFDDWIRGRSQPTTLEVEHLLFAVVALCGALISSTIFRRKADREIAKLED